MAAVTLVVAPAIDWVASAILIRAAQRLNEPALAERATASVILTIAATCIAIPSAAFVVKANLGGVGTIILIGGLLLVTLPQLVWLVSYWRGHFR